ncbi:hypothetical protein WN51_06265 [Melipona quadrifasciata]|uniref:Uncharacterized protein n=1 Tax=Melipona quadrifasciata TaxID=166423 RepID=A0A0M8ZQI0_9HYME|nr:hypothetical protein WN51_06265 [Melipona quadrifasciata]
MLIRASYTSRKHGFVLRPEALTPPNEIRLKRIARASNASHGQIYQKLDTRFVVRKLF